MVRHCINRENARNIWAQEPSTTIFGWLLSSSSRQLQKWGDTLSYLAFPTLPLTVSQAPSDYKKCNAVRKGVGEWKSSTPSIFFDETWEMEMLDVDVLVTNILSHFGFSLLRKL